MSSAAGEHTEEILLESGPTAEDAANYLWTRSTTGKLVVTGFGMG